MQHAANDSTLSASIQPELAGNTLSRRLIGAVAATAIISFLGLFLETVLNVLFPALMADFAISITGVSWMTSAYLLVVAVTMPTTGWLQRRFSARSLFMVAGATVVAGALIAAISPNYGVLLAGRMLQGVGTAIATPLMFTTIMMKAPRPKVGILMGMGALVLGTAPAAGPIVGGLVGTFATWRLIFWVVCPLVIVAMILGWLCLDADYPADKPTLNVGELVLTALTFAGLLLGIERTGTLLSGTTAATGVSVGLAVAFWVVGLVCLALLIRSLLTSTSPLIHLSVLRAPKYRWSFIAFGLFQFCALGFGYILPNVAQLSMGKTALQAGLLVLPGTIVGAVLAPVGGMLLDKLGARKPILIGTCIVLLGAAILAILGTASGVLCLGVGYTVFSLGFAITYANTQTHGMHHVEHRLSPDATGLMNTWQQFSGALAMTVLSTIMALRQGDTVVGSPAYQAGSASGADIGMIVITCVVALALGAQILAHKRRG